MRYYEAVEFDDRLFFSGSVEIDWIYTNKELANLAANSFVFHSQKSFSISDDGKIDTIAFTKILFENIYNESNGNPFITGIAGYGSGKSHLSTAIAALFANNERFLEYNQVIKNIEKLDSAFAQYICDNKSKPNIVFAFNGMNDFNLTISMTEQIQYYLQLSGINIELFQDSDDVFVKAQKFVKSNFNNQNFQNVLAKNLQQDKYKYIPNKLDYFVNNIKDNEVFEIVNIISEEITGNRYNIERFLNPKVILEEINQKLCGKGKPFGKVLIIFDEIGRYIEWLGTKSYHDPSIMQQLYEGIKNSNGSVTFLSFIQFPLTTYFSHLNPGVFSHIARYVDRYKSARIFHLSTVLESVFANLIAIKDPSNFSDYSFLHENILSWQPQLLNSVHWANEAIYKKLICDKLKPFHPLTILLLSRLSDYTQKRGPLKILSELLENSKNFEISNVPAIFPVSIFDTEFTADIVKMEDDGLIKSDYVSVYDRLLGKSKIKGHINSEDMAFLQAIVICNLLDLKPVSENDYRYLISNLNGFDDSQISDVIRKLESELGVIKYDNELFIHHIELDAVGRKDFNRFLLVKRNELQSEYDYTEAENFERRLNENLTDQLKNFKTAFCRNITTSEWVFPQKLIDIRKDVVNELNYIKSEASNAIMPNQAKGAMIWIYINCHLLPEYENEIDRIKDLINLINLGEHPIQIGFILDTNAELSNAIIALDSINNFTSSEREKYSAFYESHRTSIKQNIKDIFLNLRRESYYILDGSIEKTGLGYKKLIDNLIEKLYPLSLPFKFDGFSKTRFHNAKNEFIQILKAFSSRKLSKSYFKNNLLDRTYNRLVGFIGKYSWNIFDGDKIGKPNDKIVKKVFEGLKIKFDRVADENNLELSQIFNGLIAPPFGMNIYSASFLVIYSLNFYNDRFIFSHDGREYNYHNWIILIITTDVNYKIIQNTSIQYCDPEKLKDSTLNLLDEILNSRSVKDILNLKDKIDNYTDKFDYDESITQKLELVKSKIYNANELQSSFDIIETKLNYMDQCVYKGIDQIPDILKTSYELEKDWNELSQKSKGSDLDLPQNWLNHYDDVYDNIIVFLETDFENWFNDNNWPKNHNVEAFNMFCKKIAKSLYSLGMNKFGKEVNDTVVKVTRSYEFLSFCQKRISGYLNLIIPDTYEDCSKYKKDIVEFKKTITESNLLANSQKQYYLNQLNQVLKSINSKIENITKNLSDIYEDLGSKYFSDIDEIKTFINQLKSTTDSISVSHPDYLILADTLTNVENIVTSIKDLLSKTFTDKQISKEMKRLKKEFANNLQDDPDYVNCSVLFENVRNTLLSNLDVEIKEWMSVIPEKIDGSLSQSKLDQIYQYITNPPVYLNDKALARVSKVKNILNKVINTSIEKSIINQFKSIKGIKKQKQIINTLEKLLKKE